MVAPVKNDDQRDAGIALWNPPHRRLSHYFRLQKSNQLTICDDLYASMQRDDERLKYLEQFTDPSTGLLGQIFMLFYLPIFANSEGALDDMRAEESETLSRYLKTSAQYEHQCLGKPVKVQAPAKENAVERAVAVTAGLVVRGGRFLVEHPGYVAVAIGVGAVLVFVPEAAPIVLAL